MIYLITGGTGTFGQALTRRLLSMDFIDEIRILSRDEAKQWQMQKEIKDNRVKYYIGDVRDASSLQDAFKNVDAVFHAAAMKHVWSCEQFPAEAIRTNALGAANCLDVAIKSEVQRFVLLSSDKAVFPTGAMGMTKAIAEKLVLSRCNNGVTDIVVTRFGNLIDSRGNVIEAWNLARSKGEELILTEGAATRFFMTVDEAMDLVSGAILEGEDGEVIIPECKAAWMIDLLEAYTEKYDYHKMKAIGLTQGEKLHEWLDEDTCSHHAKKYSQNELMQMI